MSTRESRREYYRAYDAERREDRVEYMHLLYLERKARGIDPVKRGGPKRGPRGPYRKKTPGHLRALREARE